MHLILKVVDDDLKYHFQRLQNIVFYLYHIEVEKGASLFQSLYLESFLYYVYQNTHISKKM